MNSIVANLNGIFNEINKAIDGKNWLKNENFEYLM